MKSRKINWEKTKADKAKKALEKMTIPQLTQLCYEQAEEKGWTEKNIEFPEMAALLHSEISEALESYRHGEDLYFLDPESNPPQKPEGIFTEFADVIIRIGHYVYPLAGEGGGELLLQAIIEKLQYNQLRPHRHGGKKI